jgi:hypothetical protein
VSGESNLDILIKSMHPKINEGTYVFACVAMVEENILQKAICIFKEENGITLILKKEDAELHRIQYEYEACWITLTIHSALQAVGLTAAFSTALAKENISCNVVAGYHHDHIFVAKSDSDKALFTLNRLSNSQKV